MKTCSLKFKTLPGYRSVLEGIYIEKENKSLLSCLGDDNGIRVIAYDYEKEIFSELGCWFVTLDSIRCHGWSPDGQFLFISCEKQLLIYRWQNELQLIFSHAMYYIATDVSCYKDICLHDEDIYRVALSGPHGVELHFMTLNQNKTLFTSDSLKLHQDSYVHWLRWSESGKFLMIATLDGYLSVWERQMDRTMICWHDRLSDFDRITDMRMDTEEIRLILCTLDGHVLIYGKEETEEHRWVILKTFEILERSSLSSSSLSHPASSACFGILFEHVIFFVQGNRLEKRREDLSLDDYMEGGDFVELSSEVKGLRILKSDMFTIDRHGTLTIIPMNDQNVWQKFIDSTKLHFSLIVYQHMDGKTVRINLRQQLLLLCEQDDMNHPKELHRVKLPFYFDESMTQHLKNSSGSLKWYSLDWLFFSYEGCFYVSKVALSNSPWSCFIAEGEWVAYDLIHIESTKLQLCLLDDHYNYSIWEHDESQDDHRWSRKEKKKMIALPTKTSLVQLTSELC